MEQFFLITLQNDMKSKFTLEVFKELFGKNADYLWKAWRVDYGMRIHSFWCDLDALPNCSGKGYKDIFAKKAIELINKNFNEHGYRLVKC